MKKEENPHFELVPLKQEIEDFEQDCYQRREEKKQKIAAYLLGGITLTMGAIEALNSYTPAINALMLTGGLFILQSTIEAANFPLPNENEDPDVQALQDLVEPAYQALREKNTLILNQCTPLGNTYTIEQLARYWQSTKTS